jgi:hypothetical protein
MPISVLCPSCSAKINAPDAAAGKKVKCPRPGCGAIIAVPQAISPDFEVLEDQPPAKPTPKKVVTVIVEDVPTPKKRIKQDIEVEEEEERPKSKRRRDDDDQDEDRPRRSRGREEDEDEDDRPRRKKPKKSAGIPPLAIAGIAVGVFFFLGGIGLGIYALASKNTKTDDSAANSDSDLSSGREKAPVPAGWVMYKNEGAGFKAYFPMKTFPKPHNQSLVYMSEDVVLKSACLILVEDFLLENRASAGETAVKEFLLKDLNAKEISRKDSTLAGQRATEILVDLIPKKGTPGKGSQSKSKTGDAAPDQVIGKGVVRLLVTNRRVYLAIVACETGTPKTEWVNGFFDNFELIK